VEHRHGHLINLVGTATPSLSFRVHYQTDGGSFGGWNVTVGTVDGATFSPIGDVTPAYELTIAAEPGWGGYKSSSAWQAYTADLIAVAGPVVLDAEQREHSNVSAARDAGPTGTSGGRR
jgi:hypothetical protein